MFVGCSEISISVIVKHVKHVATCETCATSFSVSGGTEKIGGLWFARGRSEPG